MMLETFHSLIILIFLSILLVSLAQRFKISYPIILVLAGGAISFIPGLPLIRVDPEILLMSVLPPILFYAAYGLSFREFRQSIKVILLLAFFLVLATTLVVGLVFKWLFPQLPYALAFAFGAIISPPDVAAAVATLKRLKIDPKIIATLEGESLINDASSLILNKFAVVALLTGMFSLTEAVIELAKVTTGGIAVGIVTGYVCHALSQRFKDANLVIAYSLVLPYLAYIAAELLHVSGVLAVVANGIIGARLLTTHFSAQTRVVGWATWDVFIIFLNCFVFILIGSQLHMITGSMPFSELAVYCGYGLLITFVLISVRLVWIFGYNFFGHIFQGQLAKHQWQNALILSLAGMRGIVSHVAALALPIVLSNGELTPGRDIVIFMTYIVIVLSLAIPTLILPTLVRWFQAHHQINHCSLKTARHKLHQAAQGAIKTLHIDQELSDDDQEFLSTYFHTRHRIFTIAETKNLSPHIAEIARKKIVPFQRELLIELWDSHEIDDATLHVLERELDVEELQLARANPS